MAAENENARKVRRASRLPYVGAVLLLGFLVVAAWAGRDRFEPVVAGRPAPDFVATNMAGETVHLSDYQGKVVLVNIWATWCAPCREEMPSMERLYQEIRSAPGGEDFEILAVSVDANLARPDPFGRGVERDDLLAFAEEFGLTFPVVHDPEGAIQNLYMTTGVPESVVVGRDGMIYKKIAGPTEWDAPQYQELIHRLLAVE
jgi:thiol-disulfide isomerase/thioredoxin